MPEAELFAQNKSGPNPFLHASTNQAHPTFTVLFHFDHITSLLDDDVTFSVLLRFLVLLVHLALVLECLLLRLEGLDLRFDTFGVSALGKKEGERSGVDVIVFATFFFFFVFAAGRRGGVTS